METPLSHLLENRDVFSAHTNLQTLRMKKNLNRPVKQPETTWTSEGTAELFILMLPEMKLVQKCV